MHDWEGMWARPSQCEPVIPYSIWYLETGRGFGKTRTASEWVHKKVNTGHIQFGALVHRTTSDIRDIMVEGKSGLLATARPGELPNYEPSKKKITFHNGAIFNLYTAEEPDQLRGPEFDLGWGDEFATWKMITGIDGLTAFDNLRFAMRGTSNPEGPQLLLSTTPRRCRAVKSIHKDARDSRFRIVVTHGSLLENISNLDPIYVAGILAKFAGTPLGEQEIDGKLAKTVEGAIFTEWLFGQTRVVTLDDLPELNTPIVSVDPSAGDGTEDECGITVQATSAGTIPTALTHGNLSIIKDVRHGYILEDASIAGPPDVWANRVCEVAARWGAKIVVAEVNQGHEMVRSLIRARNPALRVKKVTTYRGKEVRAQPVSGLFSQKRWHIVGEMPELEDQCTTWVPGSGDSPDRLDAMVHGAAHLEPSAAAGSSSAPFNMSQLATTISGGA